MGDKVLDYQPPRDHPPRPPFAWVILGIAGAGLAIVGAPGGELGGVMGVIVGGVLLLYGCYRMVRWYGQMQDYTYDSRSQGTRKRDPHVGQRSE